MIVFKNILMKRLSYLLLFFCFLFLNKEMKSQEIYSYSFGEGVNFVSENNYEFVLSGFVQPFIEYRIINNDSIDQIYQDSRYRMRRIRLRMSGSSPQKKVDYRIQFDFSGISEDGSASSSLLYDAFITYNFNKRTKLSFGQRSQRSDNRELTMNSNSLQLVERSRLTSVFASIRDFGLFLQRDIRLSNGSYFRNYLEITSGDGMNNFTKDIGGLKYGGRIDYLPFGFFTNKGQFRQVDIVRENSLKLVLGVNYSFNQSMSSRRGRVGNDFLYYNINLADTNYRLPDFLKYGADLLLKYRGFSLLAEYIKTNVYLDNDITHRNDRYGDKPKDITDNFRNLDPKDYLRSQLMLGSGFNLQAGYIFKNLISADLRFTHLESDEFSFLNNGTFYNRPNYYTFGLSKYFARNYGFKIQASITYVEVSEGSIYSQQTGIPSEPYRNIELMGNEIIIRLITSVNF